ncbi:acyl carrier protein (plasmid) [Skermanella sp. TT6]|uniref:Acyl carrier protein n=1 Tax=Skermanella cutis TaxID=2775420 RepID=A0ABX7BGE4_9PROT|nr:acyl carrier protein [Skermanella sp. TT6]QQP93460.1 acyl carrier protein [Skermanella sp. TT6]
MSLTKEALDQDVMKQELKQFLVDQLFVDMPLDTIRTDMGLASEIGVDSLGFTELMAHLEDKYGVSISQDEFVPENFRSLDTVVALVLSKLG